MFSSFAGSVFACSCEGPNFDQKDIERVLNGFVSKKLGIQSSDISSLKEESVENFLTRVQRASLWVEKKIEEDYIYQCDKGCMMGINEKLTYKINYYDREKNKTCERDIVVKMQSNLLDNTGYKSKVKTVNKASCL